MSVTAAWMTAAEITDPDTYEKVADLAWKSVDTLEYVRQVCDPGDDQPALQLETNEIAGPHFDPDHAFSTICLAQEFGTAPLSQRI